MPITMEVDREEDGRWIAEIPSLPGCMAYGKTREESVRLAEALALRIMAERLEAGDSTEFASFAFTIST